MTLRVEGLCCARGGVRVLADVTFRVDPGRALVLRGPNGVGKTTLLRTIAGLQPPVSGQVLAEPESIAYAAHADGLKAVLTLRENLSFWAAIHGTASVDAAMAAMGLATLADRPAQDLSAGQKRRAGLARLLVTGRPVWLLDEPTVSLDTGAVATFAGVVTAHLAGGGIVVMASHLDAGIPAAAVLDLAAFRPVLPPADALDGAFG